MGRMTFVCDYADGKEPEIKDGMQFMDGRVVAASDADLVHVVLVLEKKIEDYKAREKALIDKLNDNGEPLTRKEVLLFLAPILLVSLLSLIALIFGFPVLIQMLIHWVNKG